MENKRTNQILTSKGRPLRTLRVRLAALFEREADVDAEELEVVGVDSSLVRSIAWTSSGERREEERLVE